MDDDSSNYNSAITSLYTSHTQGNPCSDLALSRTMTAIAHTLGYQHGGIGKGSYAAEGMRREATACGGGVPSMEKGGITASLQSIGSTGHVKPQAYHALSSALARTGKNVSGGRASQGMKRLK